MSGPEPKLRDLFFEALQHPAADEQAAYLNQACAGKPELRGRLESLLKAHREAGSFLCEPVPSEATIDLPPPIESPGTMIGPYKLLEQIGEGGFGVVFMAEQFEPIRRKLALKVLKPGMDTRQVVARFEAERQALAIMDHPNIAKVFDGGATPSGRPYFVMELVKGRPITEFCDQNQLTPRQRLELFVLVCQAVQHAHQKGIIHRDIKPNNVLVTMHDTTPVPKVIDFGVAKALGQELTDKTVFTGFAQMIGTPLYMSPEQAGQSGLDIDTRSDIYSLGVLLYELLTGTTPFSKDRFRQAAYEEIRRIIREEEPSKPSTKLSTAEGLPTLAANRGTEPAKLTKLVRGELDWIVMKALEKDRNRRYETSNGFAMDVMRYLAGEAVQAVPPSTAYRLKKFVRRNKGPMLAVSLVLLILVAGVVGTTWQALRAERRAEGERQAKERAEADFALANEAVEKYLGTVTADPDLRRADLNPLRKKLLEGAIPFFQRIAEHKSDDPDVEARRGRAHLRLASLRLLLVEYEAVLQDAEAARAIFARLTDEFPDRPAYRLGLAESHQDRGRALWRLGKPAESETVCRRAVDILERLVDEYPTEPAYRDELCGTLKDLAVLLRERGESREAEVVLRRTIDIQRKLADEFRTELQYRLNLAGGQNNLAGLLMAQGQLEKAEAEYLLARKIFQNLAEEFPGETSYSLDLGKHHLNLGLLYDNQRQFAKAQLEHRVALSLFEKLADKIRTVPDFREGVGRAHNHLGFSLKSAGEREKAEGAFQRAVDVREKLATEFPKVPDYGEQLAESYVDLAKVRMELRKHPAAAEAHGKARHILQKLMVEFAGEPRYRLALLGAHHNLGLTYEAMEQFEQAAEAFRRAESVMEKLPDLPRHRQRLAEITNNLGAVLYRQGDLEQALAAYRRALAIREKLVAEAPTERVYAVDLGGSYCNIGQVFSESGKWEDSLEWFEKAIARLEPVVPPKSPPASFGRRYLCNSHFGQGSALYVLGRHAEALPHWKRALELDGGSQRQVILANQAGSQVRAARAAKDTAGCIAASASFETLKRTSGVALFNAACNRALCAAVIPDDPKTPPADAARLAKEQADLAMDWLHKAVAAGFTDPAPLKVKTDLYALREREDFKKLVAELEAKKNPLH